MSIGKRLGTFGLALAGVLSAGSAAEAQVVLCALDLLDTPSTWNRPRASGSVAGSAVMCDGAAPDSVNDGQPYCVFEVRATESIASIIVESLELTAIAFDPLVAVYCGPFDPAAPDVNLIVIDDDSFGYPNAAVGFSPTAVGDTFFVVVTSYAKFLGREFGAFRVILGGLETTGACGCGIRSCAGDADTSGAVEFEDIMSILGHWNADYGAGNTGPGDANGDGVVNCDDLMVTLANWLAVCP